MDTIKIFYVTNITIKNNYIDMRSKIVIKYSQKIVIKSFKFYCYNHTIQTL